MFFNLFDLPKLPGNLQTHKTGLGWPALGLFFQPLTWPYAAFTHSVDIRDSHLLPFPCARHWLEFRSNNFRSIFNQLLSQCSLTSPSFRLQTTAWKTSPCIHTLLQATSIFKVLQNCRLEGPGHRLRTHQPPQREWLWLLGCAHLPCVKHQHFG